jgi:hypothetical protein
MTEQTVPDVAALEQRLADLESANAELSAQLADRPVRGPRWRAVVAAALIVLASLLTPVAVVSGWARVLLSDTDAVVAAYGPLVKDPRVQAYLTDQVMAAITEKVDIDGLVDDLVDGIEQVVQRPRASLALEALRRPAAAGLRSAVQAAVARAVASDAFGTAWQESLRLSHSQLIGALQGDPDSAVTITDAGVGVRIGPLIAQAKQALLDQGFAFASAIPAIDRTVILVRSDQLATVRLAYQGALATGYWLGPVVLALFAGGVLVSRRRWFAAAWAGIGMGLGALVVIAGLAVARVVAQASVPASVMPADVLLTFYDAATGAIGELALATVTLAAVITLVAYLGGESRPAAGVRTRYATLTAGARDWSADHGVRTGGFGRWLYRRRIAVRAAVASLAVVVLAINRPISFGLVCTIAVAAVAAIVLADVLARPDEAG